MEYLQKVKGHWKKTLLTTCLPNQPGLHILTSCKVPIDTSRTFFDTNGNCIQGEGREPPLYTSSNFLYLNH